MTIIRPKLLQRGAALLALVHFFLPIEAHSFSIGEERLLGEKLLYAVRGEFELIDAPDISEYVNGLGRQVLAAAGPQYFDYHFFVVKNDQFNAFAAPSGLIFLNSGLIRTMRSEDQLVSVMAHEIGHVVSRHIASRMAKQTKVTALSLLFGLASLAAGDPALTSGLFTGALAAGGAASLSFSRQDEEQADRLAFDWLRDMGRDPAAMEEMLKTMRRITRYSSEQLPPYLLTHPNPEDRLHYVQSLLEHDSARTAPSLAAKKLAADRFSFLRFKHRVLSQALEPEQMRTWCAGTIAAGRDAEEAGMARYGLALLRAREMDFSGAVKLLQEVRQDFSGREILDVDLAAMLLDAGRTAEALPLLRRARQRDRTDRHAAFHLARALENSGDLDGSEQLYLETAKALPDYPQIYYELGRLKARQGQSAASNFYLARHHLCKGRIAYAKRHLQRAEKDLSLAAALREEARLILERLKQLEEAS